MLPLAQKIAFLVFAGITGAIGAWGFYRLYRRISCGACGCGCAVGSAAGAGLVCADDYAAAEQDVSEAAGG